MFKKNRLSVFQKNRDLEFSVSLATFCSLPWCIGEGAPLIFLEAFSMILPMSILCHALLWFWGFSRRHSGEALHGIVYFEDSISVLLFRMYQVGLRLEQKTGEHYIFTTNYFLLPQDQFVVEAKDGYCTLQAKQVCIEFLEEHIGLKKHLEESKISNASKPSARKEYSSPSQGCAMPIIG